MHESCITDHHNLLFFASKEEYYPHTVVVNVPQLGTIGKNHIQSRFRLFLYLLFSLL